MTPSNDQERKKLLESIRASISMLGFGLILLVFLVAIDRPQWFVLRPASGTATAMSKASQPHHRADNFGDREDVSAGTTR